MSEFTPTVYPAKISSQCGQPLNDDEQLLDGHYNKSNNNSLINSLPHVNPSTMLIHYLAQATTISQLLTAQLYSLL